MSPYQRQWQDGGRNGSTERSSPRPAGVKFDLSLCSSSQGANWSQDDHEASTLLRMADEPLVLVPPVYFTGSTQNATAIMGKLGDTQVYFIFNDSGQ